MSSSDELTLLQRREIESRIVGPLINAFIDQFGHDATLAIVERVIRALAREAGEQTAAKRGSNDLLAFSINLDEWTAGGALEMVVLEKSSERLEFNVVRCRYAEMYRSLGLLDLGSTLSCCRDAALVEGFNPKIELTRTQTLMQGATHCDFKFSTKSALSAHSENSSQNSNEIT